jgi:hypothetical protein
MKARAALVASSALLGLTALAGPAAAQPPGAGLNTITATCNGQDVTVTIAGDGTSFWLGDQHYLLTSLEATLGGQEFSMNWGQKVGLQGDQIECTGTLEQPEGPVEFVVTAVAVP